MRRLTCASIISLLLSSAAAVQAQDGAVRAKRAVSVTLKTGDTLSGTLAQINPEQIDLDLGNAYKTIKLDDITAISFAAPSTPAARPPAASTQPAPEQYQAAAAEAIGALRRLTSATDVGVSLHQYGQLVVDVHEQVSGALTYIPEGDIRTEIQSAMGDYAYAREIWNASLNYRDGDIPTKSDVSRAFNARYNLGIQPKIGSVLKLKPTLDLIWQSAANHMLKVLRMLQ